MEDGGRSVTGRVRPVIVMAPSHLRVAAVMIQDNLRPLVALIVVAFSSGLSSALDPTLEDFKVRPLSSPNANFGYDVDLGGGLLVAGDNGNSLEGFNAGAAFVFNADTGSQLFELHPTDAAARDNFGVAVAISDGQIVVGANAANERAVRGGAAYVFDAATGLQTHKLQPADSFVGDLFGTSVAIGEGSIVVGTDYLSDRVPRPGAAYVFDAATGAQAKKLLPNDSANRDFFGRSVAIDGNVAIVGAIGARGATTLSGAAYVFDLTTGAQSLKLMASDGFSFQNFGDSVAVDNGVIVVGALGTTGREGTSPGSAYVFDLLTGNQLFKLVSPTPAVGDQFGMSVAISEGRILVGSSLSKEFGDAGGAGYLFDAATGELLEVLLSSDVARFDGLGGSVAMEGNTAVLGATGDEWSASQSGSAYMFTTIPEPTALALVTMLAGCGMMGRRFA